MLNDINGLLSITCFLFHYYCQRKILAITFLFAPPLKKIDYVSALFKILYPDRHLTDALLLTIHSSEPFEWLCQYVLNNLSLQFPLLDFKFQCNKSEKLYIYIKDKKLLYLINKNAFTFSKIYFKFI